MVKWLLAWIGLAMCGSYLSRRYDYINAGGRTRLAGTIHGLFLLAVLLGLGQLAAYIPLSVLAGIRIPIGFAISDKATE